MQFTTRKYNVCGLCVYFVSVKIMNTVHAFIYLPFHFRWTSCGTFSVKILKFLIGLSRLNICVCVSGKCHVKVGVICVGGGVWGEVCELKFYAALR